MFEKKKVYQFKYITIFGVKHESFIVARNNSKAFKNFMKEVGFDNIGKILSVEVIK